MQHLDSFCSTMGMPTAMLLVSSLSKALETEWRKDGVGGERTRYGEGVRAHGFNTLLLIGPFCAKVSCPQMLRC